MMKPDLMPMLLQFNQVGVVLRKIHGGNGWEFWFRPTDLLFNFFSFPYLYETDARWSVPRWYPQPSLWVKTVDPERSSAFSRWSLSFQDSTRWFRLLWRQHFRKCDKGKMTLPAVDFRIHFPTNPRVSLSLISKEIPSLKLTVPTCLRKTPLVMGKCFERFSTLSKVSEELVLRKNFFGIPPTRNLVFCVRHLKPRIFVLALFRHVCKCGAKGQESVDGDPEVVLWCSPTFLSAHSISEVL